jgi:glycerol 2-dehydrogenase (NADP+)
MWSLQRDTSIIPKSVTPSRIDSNFQLDGWELSESSMKALDGIKTRFKVVYDSWMPIQVFFGDDE